jgi:glycosyltransferase involved in cell wall biosynthesis
VTGVQRYAQELLRALDRAIGLRSRDSLVHSFHLLLPRSAQRLPRFEHISVDQVGRLGGHPWEQLELPWHARKGLLLSLANTGPLLKQRQIVTMHDASVFAFSEAYSAAFGWWYRFLLPALGSRVRRVVTDSEFSKSELVRYAHIPPDRIRVIPLSGEHIRDVEPDQGILARLGLGSRAYLLAVGSRSPHKNFRTVAQAVERLCARDFDVVVAGGRNEHVFGSTAAQLDPGLTHTGYVSDAELRALYEGAACFVYPSLYEGFGLPLLEAMTCGCPVIASRAASLPEVAGSAAMYCDPLSPDNVADCINQVMHDEALQERLRRLGRERALQFTWASSAKAMLHLIDEVAAA